MTVESTITALQALTKSFATDDMPDFDAFIRINAEIETLMPTLDLTRAEAIATQLAALEVIVQQKIYRPQKRNITTRTQTTRNEGIWSFEIPYTPAHRERCLS